MKRYFLKRVDSKEIQKYQKKILKQYDENEKLYNEFLNKLEKLIENLLKVKNIKLHQVKSRLKERDSLGKKILKKAIIKNDGKYHLYTTIEDITDVCALRIVLLDESEIEPVLALLREEFEIDDDNTNDQRIKDPNKFGYLSHHTVLSLNKTRCQLVEYENFKSLKLEVQTRSILQHTWAEIEHGLNYKSEKKLDDNLHRHLNRLAATLELIEHGFKQIIKNHNDISMQETPINEISLYRMINSNVKIKELDNLLIQIQYEKEMPMPDVELYELIIKNLKLLSINSIEKLNQSLKKDFSNLKIFIEQFSGNEMGYMNEKGECLVYLCLYKAFNQFEGDDLSNFLKEFSKNYLSIMNLYKRVRTLKQLNLKGEL